LLGSSTFSAQLAAKLGLPFAFASHFAPDLLMNAIGLYRAQFRASRFLAAPYVMAGVPVIAADTDAAAERLATSPKQRFLKLIRGEALFMEPPVESMEGLWNEAERQVVEGKLAVAVIGGPSKVRAGFAAFLAATGVDEVVLTCDAYSHADRLRSFELAAEAIGGI
jgi:luciferase family oxidoreductase group 1